MNKRLYFSCVFLFVLSVIFAGCNGISPKDGKGQRDEATIGKAGGTLIYGRGSDAVKLDPSTVTDGESLIVTHQVLETLVAYEKESTEIVPHLAKDWEISDDGLTYTFQLEEGITFHDGTDFNAKAVVKNFERWLNGKDEAEFPYFVSQFGGFHGDEDAVIKEVKAIDEYEVQFVLSRPQAPFLKNLAMPPFAISSPTAFEEKGEKYIEHPIGTGPFQFEEWKRNDTITVVKNEKYWKEELPKVDKVIFKVIEDNSARLNSLIKGEIDLMDGLNPSDVDRVNADNNLQIFERPSMNVGYLGFNVEKGPFNNKKVRQALCHAINKESIIENFYEGTAEPAKNPIPPTINGYNDQIKDYQYDLDKAKQLLDEAGYSDGFKIDLWAMPVPRPYMPNGEKIAEAIQADFKKIGVEVNIVTMEWATYLEKVRTGEAPMFMLGWTGDNGDADNFLYVLLDQDNINSNNYSRYANDELHELLLKAQKETDAEKRDEYYYQAQEMIHEDAPWIPLAHSVPQLAGKSSVQGFTPHPTGSQSFADVSVIE